MEKALEMEMRRRKLSNFCQMTNLYNMESERQTTQSEGGQDASRSIRFIILKVYKGWLMTWVLNGISRRLVHSNCSELDRNAPTTIEKLNEKVTFRSWGSWETAYYKCQEGDDGATKEQWQEIVRDLCLSVSLHTDKRDMDIPESREEFNRMMETNIQGPAEDSTMDTNIQGPAEDSTGQPFPLAILSKFIVEAEKALEELSKMIFGDAFESSEIKKLLENEEIRPENKLVRIRHFIVKVNHSSCPHLLVRRALFTWHYSLDETFSYRSTLCRMMHCLLSHS